MSALFWILVSVSVLFLLVFIYVIISSVLLSRNTKRLLTNEKQNWFDVQYSSIAITGEAADQVAQIELRHQDAVCLMDITKKDALWKKYIAPKKGEKEINLLPEEKISVCVYGSSIVAMQLADQKICRTYDDSQFNRDLTPPNPKVLKAIHNEGLFKILSFVFGIGFLVLVLATLLSVAFIK